MKIIYIMHDQLQFLNVGILLTGTILYAVQMKLAAIVAKQLQLRFISLVHADLFHFICNGIAVSILEAWPNFIRCLQI